MNRFRNLGVLMAAVLLFAACSGAPAAQAPTSGAAAPVEATAAAPAAATVAPVAEATTAPAAADATSAPVPTVEPKPVTSILTLKMKSGLKWSDGSDLTSKDVVGTYDLLWAKADGVWAGLSDVVAVDPQTVEFRIAVGSPRLERLLLRSNQAGPYSQYGEWMDQASELRAQNLSPEDPKVQALVEDLLAFKPDTSVTYGPFNLDPASVTEAQLELVKNPTGFNADKIDLEKLIVYYGETAASVPLVLSGDLDYSTHGYTPADLAAFEQLPNVQIVRGPTGTGPALWFNESVPPLDKKEVRQAFAYVIDRSENAQVAMGESGKPFEYMAGFSELIVPQWLTQETIAKLNPYTKDLNKAEALLTGLGYKKGGDSAWADETGKPLTFEMSVPSDFADWLGAAENASQQLNAFGIKTTVRGYQSSERSKMIKESTYQILVDVAIRNSPPHPNSAFRSYMTNDVNNANNPEATEGGKGINWPWTQTAPDGTQINVKEYVDKSAEGFDVEAQKKYVETLALIYNDQLPVLGLFERYSNDPINTSARVTGWKPLDDAVYQNNQGGDNYMAVQILDGTLKAAPEGDKSFRTSWPYPQPPNYDLNFFNLDSGLQQNVGYPALNVLYPPFFWYSTAEGKYVPVIAESFELKDAS